MSIDRPRKGSVNLAPDTDQALARREFHWALSRYQGGRRYRGIVEQDLRDLWLKTAGPEHRRDAFMLFYQWLELGEKERDQWPGAEAYITRLEHFVGDRFRCRVDGEPARWLMQEMHADVVGAAHHWIDVRELAHQGDAERAVVSLTIEVGAHGGTRLQLVDVSAGVTLPLGGGHDTIRTTRPVSVSRIGKNCGSGRSKAFTRP